ncbi:hypothetical protein D4764_14G0007160 [Takifugu flavidus]|uniref:Ig-like domain-containing protein n=1 Tax=Takifugu flavidus TaxID=433684 RepID=A0A5C6P534_9TELE|nr:hypothetical protein D4764_14G0007160 [Takifugu flavidus]
MLKSLFVYGVLGVSVLLIPAKSNKISVCIEDEKDLRVDCLIKPEPSKSNTFQFSWSSGSKESVITTNDSRLSPDTDFKTTVKELTPHGYRMTLTNFTDKLPRNSSLLCKLSGKTAKVVVVNDKLPKCSAGNVFLRSPISWIFCLLLFFYQTQS